MSRFAFGLRHLPFGLGSALDTREHLVWSIDPTQDCPNLCDAVCAILITATPRTLPKELSVEAASGEWAPLIVAAVNHRWRIAGRGRILRPC
jgi:hypothetical protein